MDNCTLWTVTEELHGYVSCQGSYINMNASTMGLSTIPKAIVTDAFRSWCTRSSTGYQRLLPKGNCCDGERNFFAAYDILMLNPAVLGSAERSSVRKYRRLALILDGASADEEDASTGDLTAPRLAPPRVGSASQIQGAGLDSRRATTGGPMRLHRRLHHHSLLPRSKGRPMCHGDVARPSSARPTS